MGLSLSILSSAWNEILGYNIFDLVAATTKGGARSIRMAIRTSSFKRQDSGMLMMNTNEATKELPRSLSFKEWDMISEPSSSPSPPPPSSSTSVKKEDDHHPAVVVLPLKKKGHLESITKPTIQLPDQQPFVFFSPKPKAEVDELAAKPYVFVSPKPKAELDEAATKVQKVYKSYRTRRNLADCAVLVEELWWKTLDSAALKRLSVSFFDIDKKETAVSRWSRATARLAKVGKGLSKDEKAQKLALQHWLEAIDARHRYGHNLHLYYDVWSASKSTQPFFYWLDVGDGKEVNLEKCSRQHLQSQCISYLGPKEREVYEVFVEGGKLVYRQDGRLLNTAEGSKWIFVLSTSRNLYVGQKKKGTFQHSSFLSGAAITAAGRLVARDGVLEAIWPYSGHYLPTEDNFNEFISFLEQNKLDLTNVKRCAVDDDDASSKIVRRGSNKSEEPEETAASAIINAVEASKAISIAASNQPQASTETSSRRPPAFDAPKRLSCKWTSGVGPRIGCVSDYPAELRFQALEQVSLSPRLTPGRLNSPLPIPSPRPSPKIRVSPRLACMGLPSPRVQVAC